MRQTAMQTTPHFLYGPLRGGSTLFRAMVKSNPAVICPGENDYLFDFLSNQDGVWRYDTAALKENRIFRASPVTWPEGKNGLEALHDMIAQMSTDGRHPTLMAHRHANRIAEIFPDARVVELRRDPRDVARSCIPMGWAADVYHGLGHWIETFDSMEAARPLFVTPPLTIYYEKLVSEPERYLREVCEFLDIAFDADMLRYHEWSTYAAPDPSLSFQWKKKMAPDDVALVEGRAGDRLAAYGYSPSGVAPRKPARLERGLMAVRNRVYKTRFRARRFGWMTVLQRAIAARLGLEGLRKSAEDRIQMKTRQYLK